jgi:hypothetical protein
MSKFCVRPHLTCLREHSAAAILLRFPLHRRSRRVLHLKPIGGAPGTVAESLRFDTIPSSPILQAWAKTVRAVALHVLVPSDTVANLGQHRSEGGFADIEWITSEVVAVQFDEVERVEEYVAIIAPIANVIEGCDTIIVADDCLAVDDARPAA